MFHNTSVRFVCAIILFAISIATRFPLVDRYYEYSFEADSRRCVEETKSFYFFFKAPAKENFPDPLNAYPNYSDGDYIVSALLANALRPFFKSGIIKSSLGDADNTLVIFSMRWSGVLFDAAAVVLTFLILTLLSGNLLLSFSICLLYFLLNPQTLNVDLIRIDHYGLFAATLVMWSSIALFMFPGKKRYYLSCGIAAGLVSATKINFPFYLLILLLALILLAIGKKLSIRNFLILCISAGGTFAFMYIRWLLYPENIYKTIITTLNSGEQWFIFWGNKNYFYYLWDQFYNHGFSYYVLAFLSLFYISFIYSMVTAWKKKDKMMLMLCTVFMVQMLALMFSPKVPRYGMIVPLWVSIFTSTSLSYLVKRIPHRIAAVFVMILPVIPVFLYSADDYMAGVKQAFNREFSILATRKAPLKWVTDHVKDYSVIGLQFPELSYPPVFELPFVFSSETLQYPFLDKMALSKLIPPARDVLKNNFNYLFISNKEKDFHLLTMQQYRFDSLFVDNWKKFYDSLPNYFPCENFASNYENYGVNKISIYHLNDSALYTGISPIRSRDSIENNRVGLYWSYMHSLGSNAYSFQVQISEDSLMRWLVYGSRNGIASKFRAPHNPQLISDEAFSCIPDKINRAFDAGKFDFALDGLRALDKKAEFENFFAGILLLMKERRVTFGEGMKVKLHGEDPAFAQVIVPLYAEKGNILNMYLEDFLNATALIIKAEELNGELRYACSWKFNPPAYLKNAKRYYWRLRFKDNDKVLSRWSEISSFEYQFPR